jgi:hypothetical protein
MNKQWVVDLECSDSELSSLAQGLQYALASVKRLKAILEEDATDTARRGVARSELLLRDLTRMSEQTSMLLAQVGQPSYGWRLVGDEEPVPSAH